MEVTLILQAKICQNGKRGTALQSPERGGGLFVGFLLLLLFFFGWLVSWLIFLFFFMCVSVSLCVCIPDTHTCVEWRMAGLVPPYAVYLYSVQGLTLDNRKEKR